MAHLYSFSSYNQQLGADDSAEADPEGADSLRLYAHCTPHSLAARPDLQGDQAAQACPACHGKPRQIMKGFQCFLSSFCSDIDFLSRMELTQKSLYFTPQLTRHGIAA